MVDGTPTGKETDGVNYLRFLTSLKSYIGTEKSVSIAAPASFWYLKGFPIQEMSAVIDYIVYMTYDLHGQWDYGNPNSFDQCDSGKCIRSHVNLPETTNALSMITKPAWRITKSLLVRPVVDDPSTWHPKAVGARCATSLARKHNLMRLLGSAQTHVVILRIMMSPKCKETVKVPRYSTMTRRVRIS